MQKLLIVVDYQNDFVTGSLGCPQARAIEDAVSAKIRDCRSSGGSVAFTLDTHGQDYADTLEGRNLPVMHCIRSTDGWRLYGRVADEWREGDLCFEKSSFGSPELFDYLRGQQPRSVEICGVATDICVMANALLARTALPNTPVVVDAACVASPDERLGDKALDVMGSLQIEVIGR
jgi:nicotinamidase/pyrazinamidase